MTDLVIPLAVAVIGLAATGWGAVVGSRAAKFGAEKSADAARRQVQDQATVEHGHWLRQQRLSAYEGFLEAWDECLRITQASADSHDPDSTQLDDLRLAADRMAERARRIAILGPPEVTHAAESLAETMQDDVRISVRFVEVLRSATAEIDGRPIPLDALTEATEEHQRRTQALLDLIASHQEQGRDPRELDGHPLLHAAMEGIEQFRLSSRAAQEALTENFERLTAASDEAFAMADELRKNRDARELSREQFTNAARTALSAPPLSSSTETRTETTSTRTARTWRRHRIR